MLYTLAALSSVQAIKVSHKEPHKLSLDLLEVKSKSTVTDNVLDYQGFLPYDDFNTAWEELNANGDWLNNAISQDHGMVYRSADEVPHDDAWCE